MKSEEFILLFWKYYISLEKEFTSCLEYVELDSINYSVYSTKFSKILLEVGSEIDVVLKKYCKYLSQNFKYRTIDKYHNCINEMRPKFYNESINIQNKDIVLKPWLEWKFKDSNPKWWTIYNEIKHERTTKIEIDNIKMESYKFGTLGNVLNALAGLYQILIYFYYDISVAENKKINSPIPGSRLFELSGNLGKNITFYGNDAFYLDNGKIIWEHGLFYY